MKLCKARQSWVKINPEHCPGLFHSYRTNAKPLILKRKFSSFLAIYQCSVPQFYARQRGVEDDPPTDSRDPKELPKAAIFCCLAQEIAQDLSEGAVAFFFVSMTPITYNPLAIDQHIPHLAVATSEQPTVQNPVATGCRQVRIIAVQHQPISALANFQCADRLTQRRAPPSSAASYSVRPTIG